MSRLSVAEECAFVTYAYLVVNGLSCASLLLK